MGFARASKEWVILGVTESGELFDVPNWPERLCGMLADQAKDNRLSYSGYLKPVHINGFPSVVMLTSLAKDDPASYSIVKQFVAENRLRSRPGRSGAGEPPALLKDRRNYIKG
ncbi:MAG: DUF3579 domain-containing protein [Gallionella sp.]